MSSWFVISFCSVVVAACRTGLFSPVICFFILFWMNNWREIEKLVTLATVLDHLKVFLSLQAAKNKGKAEEWAHVDFVDAWVKMITIVREAPLLSLQLHLLLSHESTDVECFLCSWNLTPRSRMSPLPASSEPEVAPAENPEHQWRHCLKHSLLSAATDLTAQFEALDAETLFTVTH